MVPENIHTHPKEGWVESQEPSFFKGKGKSKMEFPEGSGVKQINKY